MRKSRSRQSVTSRPAARHARLTCIARPRSRRCSLLRTIGRTLSISARHTRQRKHRKATASTCLPTKGSRHLRRAASPSRPAGSAGCNWRGGADALAKHACLRLVPRHAAAKTLRLLHGACRRERRHALAAAAATAWRACAVASRPASPRAALSRCLRWRAAPRPRALRLHPRRSTCVAC